jgi:hypothetical protein
MKRTRMLPVLVALSVPALTAAQTPTPPTRTRTQMENPANSGDMLQQACAPTAVLIAPAMPLRITGAAARGHYMFGPNDSMIIGAGTKQGLQPGQEYYVRRVVHDQFTPMTAASVLTSVHTAGWVRIVNATDDMAIATVTQACDGMLEGDYLEPFAAPAPPPETVAPDGQPDYGHPAQLVLADERRQSGYPGMLMLIDRGTDQDVRAGQRLTIFRQTAGGGGPVLNVGTATVLNVRPQTALVRIDTSQDAVYIGDLVALHR